MRTDRQTERTREWQYHKQTIRVAIAECSWTNIAHRKTREFSCLIVSCHIISGFPYNKVVTKTLYLLVLDYDRFSRDDPIGEVCLPLSELDLGAGLTLWKTLTPCKGAAVLYTVSQKTSKIIFYYNYVKLPPNPTIFGTKMANCLKLYEVHSFPLT